MTFLVIRSVLGVPGTCHGDDTCSHHETRQQCIRNPARGKPTRISGRAISTLLINHLAPKRSDKQYINLNSVQRKNESTPMTSYILTLQCPDQPGIVRTVANAIAAFGGNIIENDQFTDPPTALFCMRTRFECDIESEAEVRRLIIESLDGLSAQLSVRDEGRPHRVLILASQYDHCLADLLYRQRNGDIPMTVVAVVANHPDCAALVQQYDTAFLQRDITPATKSAVEAEILALIDTENVDVVILARYMQILSPTFCSALPGRIINIHHSFLPGFKGARPYHQAYERGVKLVGATAHFVTADLDEGPIIDQDVVRVSHARQPNDLVAIGRDVERTVLSRAVKLVCEDRVALVGKRTVVFYQ